jgi:hypothetical protein
MCLRKAKLNKKPKKEIYSGSLKSETLRVMHMSFSGSAVAKL